MRPKHDTSHVPAVLRGRFTIAEEMINRMAAVDVDELATFLVKLQQNDIDFGGSSWWTDVAECEVVCQSFAINRALALAETSTDRIVARKFTALYGSVLRRSLKSMDARRTLCGVLSACTQRALAACKIPDRSVDTWLGIALAEYGATWALLRLALRPEQN